MNRNYILITPSKNEGANLLNLIESVTSQSIMPVVWTIIDDGSVDETSTILKEITKKHKWILALKLQDNKERDIGLHLAEIMSNGFDYTIEYCRKHFIDYDYIGNVDADLTLTKFFFENLMTEFEKDSNLGIASGGTDYMVGAKIITSKAPIDEPSGGHMLIRRRCFEECNGFPISYVADAVLKAKARIRGWKTCRFEQNRAREVRDVNSAEGYWKGFIKKGKASYYVNHHPIHIIANTCKYSIRYPYFTGIPYLYTYIGCALRKDERTTDVEVKNYFHNKWKDNFKKRFNRNY